VAIDVAQTKRSTYRWARFLHVYTSMICLIIVLFFSLTGITLNHPTWTLGGGTTTQTVSGSFPFAVTSNGYVDYLRIAEYIRKQYDVKGAVDSYETSGNEGSIAFKNPGYSADLFFVVDAATYKLTVEQSGWIAVMNDLHKGRDTGSSWKWVIDIAGGLLALISITGLVMQFFLRKRRRSALSMAIVGAVIVGILIVVTIS